MPPDVGGVEVGGEMGAGVRGGIVGLVAIGAGVIGAVGTLEHPALDCIALLTVSDQTPLTSLVDTQKNAPPLHG
jgi:hypothetical protein